MEILRTLIILSMLSIFPQTKAALTMAFVSSSDKDFLPLEYNCAKIRQACIEVYGEEWFKQNIIYERKYSNGAVFLSNTNFLQISCKRVTPRDLIALKTVFDHMAYCNDTLYVPVIEKTFEKIHSIHSAFDNYLLEETSFNFKETVLYPVMYFLRVGKAPNRKSNKLIIADFMPFSLGNGGIVGESLMEYENKCLKSNYLDLSYSLFDKEKVSEKDIDLYYAYTMASDKQLLETRPKRIIPIDVRYDYSPNERIVKVMNGNVFIEPD